MKHLSSIAPLVALLLLLPSFASAQPAPDSLTLTMMPPVPAAAPGHIFIEGDFESECVLPFEKAWYNEGQGDIVACQGSTVNYTAHVDLGGLAPTGWRWQAAGATSWLDRGDGTVTVVWGDGDHGQLTVTVYAEDGLSYTKTVNIRLIESPRILVASTPAYSEANGNSKVIYVCQGETIEFTELSTTTNTDIVGYYWESKMGGVASTPNYTIGSVWTDDKVVHRVYNNCGCYDEEIYEVHVLKGAILELGCYGTVCEGSVVTYKTQNPACQPYSWHVTGGTILSGQDEPVVTVLWDNPENGYGVLALDGNLCGEYACPTMMSKKIPVIGDNLAIKGQTTACTGEAVVYSIPLFGSTEYHWTISPSAGVAQGSAGGANEQMYIFNQPGTYTISVSYGCEFLECGEFVSEPLTVTVKSPLSIVGSERICLANRSDLVTSPGVDATWEVYDLAIGGQPVLTQPAQSSLAILFPHPGKYRIVATSDDYCREAEFVLTVQDAPVAPTLADLDPDNPHTSCRNSGILLKAHPQNPSHTIVWETDCGDGNGPALVSGNEVTVTYGDSVCDVSAYTYDRVLGCRSTGAYVHTVEERLPLPLNIGSPVTVCPGTTIVWGDDEVPRQEDFLYKWKIQEDMQHCASIQGDALSSAITLTVNNHTSGIYPVNFYMTLERRYCTSTIFDTIRFIVGQRDSVQLAITQSLDTVCLYTPVTFTGHGGASGTYTWLSDDSGIPFEGPAFTHGFSTPGDHHVTMRYNAYDHCTNTQYHASESAVVHVHPMPTVGGIFLDSEDGLVGVSVPTPNDYTYAWYHDGVLLPGARSDTAGYRGLGCYRCVVTDTVTGCAKTVEKCVSTPPPPCGQADMEFLDYDPCTATLRLKTHLSGTPIEWTVAGGEYALVYLDDDRTEAKIVFREAALYHITAYTTGGGCETSNYSFRVDFIPLFTFEKSCNRIVIHNNSQYASGNTPVTMRVNGTEHVGFLAGDASYSYPVPSNGTYSFELEQPCACDLGTVDFSSVNDDAVKITVAGASDSVYACNNTPLLFTASLATGAPISSILWSFSDDTYCRAEGNTFYHTFMNVAQQYDITATVTDENGCPITGTLTLTSRGNSVEAGWLEAPGSPVCPYVDHRMLRFSSDNAFFDYVNANYQWNIGDYPTLALRPAYHTANYTVLVTDKYGCKEHAQNAVVFKNRPTAIIVTDKPKYCVGDNVTLYGAPGPDTNDCTFEWDILDPEGNRLTLEKPTTSFPAALSGTYEVSLHVTNSQGCDATSNPAYVTVYPKPSAPSIGYGSRLCLDDPPVELLGSSPVAPYLHWSNGSTASAACYFTPGVATAWYYDPTSGCRSDEAHITIDAQPNYDALLTGCYERCPAFFSTPRGLSVWGLSTGTIAWNWHFNGMNIGSSVGNYTLNPLWLPLPDVGNYSLDVVYNNFLCMTTSPTLTIKAKEMCDCEDLDIRYETKWFVKGCLLYCDVTVKVCNKSSETVCLNKLEPLTDSKYIAILSNTFGPSALSPGECSSFSMQVEVDAFLPSSALSFRLFDECNNCEKKFSIDLTPEQFGCEEAMHPEEWKINLTLSSPSAAYITFYMNVSPAQSVLSFWSEPPMMVDCDFGQSSAVYGLAMIDIATLSQLATADSVICFHAITCDGDKLCKREYCMSAALLLNMLCEQMGRLPIPANGAVSVDSSGTAYKSTASQGQTGAPQVLFAPDAAKRTGGEPTLTPNPTSGEVTVETGAPIPGNAAGEVEEVLVMDAYGRRLATFSHTATFNVAHLPSGTYIVRVVTSQPDKPGSTRPLERVSYLKLVKM